MMHHVLRFTTSPPRTVVLSHERTLDLTLRLTAYEFVPASGEEELDKHNSEWRALPFAMKEGISTESLEKYILGHTHCFINSSFQGNPVLSEVFLAASRLSKSGENFLLRDTLQLWTAGQLLIRGPTMHPSSDALEITTTITSSSSVPPRVLANQIDHLIERRIWQLEKQILPELQKRIFARKREDWLKIFFVMVILMNALERDSWRLYYWIFHVRDGGYYNWRHPVDPKTLIEKNNTLANSLAAHFAAISKGLAPFSLDWSQEQMIGLIGGGCDADLEEVLGAMERVGRELRSLGRLGWGSRTALFTSLTENCVSRLWATYH